MFDVKFEKESMDFFDLVRSGNFKLIVSALVDDELEKAPQNVQTFYAEMDEYTEWVELNPEAYALQEAYLKANIVTTKSLRDALHVALATVYECAIIVSWNFKHIVNFRRIPLFNAVNMAHGYPPIAIYSPMEVAADEQEKI